MTSASPLSGDFRLEQDFALTEALPEDPAAIETFNVWIYDGARDIGLNLHPHAHNGEFHGAVSVFLPDGRVLRGETERGQFTDPANPGNRHMRLHCEAPFERWSYEILDLPMFETSLAEQQAGFVSPDRAPTVRVSLKVEASMAAPPWDWGALLPEAREFTRGKPGLWIANRLTDGPRPGVAYRYDQALRARGEVTVDGQVFELQGAGLRGHVRGVRIMEGFGTHNWMGGVFPSGLAFGVNTMFRPDGGYFANEGYVYRDGVFHACRVLWATPIQARAEEVDPFVVELACDALGVTRITGRDRNRLWRTLGATMGYGRDFEAPRLMSQAVAIFEHAGEVGFGMDERSCWTGEPAAM